jgi:hypothetical protein
MLGWAWCGFNKKCVGTRYVELVFLHRVGSVSHVVHSVASKARNINALFSSSGGTESDSRKSVGDMLCRTCVFLHPMGFAGHVVHSDAFRAQKDDTLFFMLMWAQCTFHKKHAGKHYAKLFFCIRCDMWVT